MSKMSKIHQCYLVTARVTKEDAEEDADIGYFRQRTTADFVASLLKHGRVLELRPPHHIACEDDLYVSCWEGPGSADPWLGFGETPEKATENAEKTLLAQLKAENISQAPGWRETFHFLVPA